MQVDSLADAPPVGGPTQLFVGPDAPIVPDAGVAASDRGNGVKTIVRVKSKTNTVLREVEAVNADSLINEHLNFLRLLALLPLPLLQEGNANLFCLWNFMIFTPPIRRIHPWQSRADRRCHLGIASGILTSQVHNIVWRLRNT